MTQTADTLLTDRTLARPVGLAALAFSVIYFVSDLIELAQGGFSPLQLALTYAGEAAIPLFVLGLYAVQRPAIGLLGLAGAVTYSYTFVFFTGTVLYAIVERTPDWEALVVSLGLWLDVHSVLMVVAGIAFGVAVARAGVLPRWTGWTLVAGMVLMAVTAAMPDVVRTPVGRGAGSGLRRDGCCGAAPVAREMTSSPHAAAVRSTTSTGPPRRRDVSRPPRSAAASARAAAAPPGRPARRAPARTPSAAAGPS